MHPDVFTDTWAEAWRRALNASPAYRAAAATWDGAVALLMTADSALGVPEQRAVYLDLHRGACRDARSATDHDLEAAAYVVAAEPALWRELLAGRTSPITALMGGKLRLLRGSLASLLPYVGAAQELVATATRIHHEFPEPAT
jgi:putative sterol carrier protein